MKRILLPLSILFGGAVVAMVSAHFSSPSVLDWELRTPAEGAVQEQIVIRFNRPMDRVSVEEHLNITPQIEGSLSWTEGTLFFTPTEPLPRGATTTVAVGEGARDVYGRVLSRERKKEFVLPSQQFVFLNTDGQITLAQLDGKITTLTERKTVVDMAAGIDRNIVWYLHQPSADASTELWQLNTETRSETQVLLQSPGKLSQLSIGKNGDAYVVVTPLEATQGIPTPASIELATGAVTPLAFGGAESSLAFLNLASDKVTLIGSDAEAVQHLRSVFTDSVVSLTKLTQYRGSDLAGRRLVFEDIVPDKNYASEIVVYDGLQRRVPLIDVNGAMPTLSPGGSIVAYSFQGTSPRNQLEVAAGESLLASLTLPVYGVRVQAPTEAAPRWEAQEQGTSFEMPKFSPDGRVLALESFSAAQLRDLRSLREYGEPNKPVYSRIRLLESATGSFLEAEFLGREVLWLP